MQQEDTGAIQVLAIIPQHALPLTEVCSTPTPEGVKAPDILHHRVVRLVVEGRIQGAQEADLRVAQVDQRLEAEITKRNSNPK